MADSADDRPAQSSLFAQVLREEIDAIETRRRTVLPILEALQHRPAETTKGVEWTGKSPTEVEETRNIEKRALEKQLCGVALSGGGIRSATFGLGVLQALARQRLLPHIDYLSTVSGGGYIGGWLAAWLKRESDNPACPSPATVIANVQSQLSPSRAMQAAGRLKFPGVIYDDDPEPIHHLRSYSNYLTPRLGLFSADSWVLLAIYLRNLLLNQLALIPFILTVLIVVRLVVLAFAVLPNSIGKVVLTLLWIAAFAVAAIGVARFLWRSVKAREGTLGTTNIRVELSLLHGFILVPLLIVGILFTALSTLANEQSLSWPIDRLLHGLLVGLPMGLLNALKYAGVWLIVRRNLQRPPSIGIEFNAWAIACGFIAGMLYGISAYLIFMWGFHELYGAAQCSVNHRCWTASSTFSICNDFVSRNRPATREHG